ncbi:MAG: UvrD-helicase domain-containing protein [Phycisphaerae bacterium]|nr:UvrD-helicase domain-containing protein [Phycisphaerae bacterium]
MPSRTDANLERLLADLNPPQREAVMHADGPLLILAGPGSGKTRVVTRRAAYLAATVAAAHEILAITFTNKAAEEMRERIAALGVGEGMTVSTFHAWCARLLRIYHEEAGLERNFSILDRDDRRKIVKQAIEECGLTTDNYPASAGDAIISDAKNAMLSVADFTEQRSDWRQRTWARVYARYEELLAEMASLDFDDLLLRAAGLLGRNAELRDRLEERYRYVLVDEYQDTNTAQYLLARCLTQRRKNLCATGDPDQSIYGWRGANIENILSFERDYPEAKVVRLEQNYRSTRRILAAADTLIAGNLKRKAKALWTENDEGPAVRVMDCDNGQQEATIIAREIAERFRHGNAGGGIAVFYRVNALSRGIEEALLREGVRYQVARGVEFYNRREIKDVIAYLRVLSNPADEVALLRIINTPARGIGTTTIERVRERSKESGRRMLELISDAAERKRFGRAAGKLGDFAELVAKLSPLIAGAPATALRIVLRESGLEAMYRGEQRSGGDDAAANLDELVNAATVFEQDHPEATVLDWLEHAALVSDVDAIDEEGQDVTLMTLHAAKGLEFDVVYIVGLEEGMLPFRRHDDASGAASDIEEERRLCFVGITRARKELTLSLARFRMLRGITQRTVRSPFLDELPRESLQWMPFAADGGGRAAAPRGASAPSAEFADWHVGTLVEHPLHGLGRVVAFSRGLRQTHLDVQFRSGKRHSWVLEFADLKRVDFDEIGESA